MRIANKTTIRFDDTKVEVGAFGVDRHLMHPIFQWLDYSYKDYGGFAKVTDDRFIGGFRNRLVAGINILNGSIDNQQFANIGGQKGALLSSSIDRSKNTSRLCRGQLLLPAACGGDRGHAVPLRHARPAGSLPQRWRSVGSDRVQSLVPKLGLLWEVDRPGRSTPTSRAAPRCRALAKARTSRGLTSIPFSSIQPQTATTYEIGTRDQAARLRLGPHRLPREIPNELQCLYSSFGNCTVVNADRTDAPRPYEIGFGRPQTVLKRILAHGDRPGPPVAQRGLYAQRLPLRRRCHVRRQRAAGSAQALPAQRAALQASAGDLLLSQRQVGTARPTTSTAPTRLKTEPYAILGPQARLRRRRAASFFSSGRNLSDVAYIASASIIDTATAGPRPCSSRATEGLFLPG